MDTRNVPLLVTLVTIFVGMLTNLVNQMFTATVYIF